jgi:hypothetical protein
MPQAPINMNMAGWTRSQFSPNIIFAMSLFRSGGGIWAMARPRSLSFSTTDILLSLSWFPRLDSVTR